MTTLEIVKLAASIQVGTNLQGYGNQVLVVEEINKNGFKGYSKYAFDKYGKKSTTYLSYETLMNPHYNKDIKVLN